MVSGDKESEMLEDAASDGFAESQGDQGGRLRFGCTVHRFLTIEI